MSAGHKQRIIIKLQKLLMEVIKADKSGLCNPMQIRKNKALILKQLDDLRYSDNADFSVSNIIQFNDMWKFYSLVNKIWRIGLQFKSTDNGKQLLPGIKAEILGVVGGYYWKKTLNNTHPTISHRFLTLHECKYDLLSSFKYINEP